MLQKLGTYIIPLAYAGGLGCLLLAFVWRGLTYLGYALPRLSSEGGDLYYMTFYKGALILLLASVAATSYEAYCRKA